MELADELEQRRLALPGSTDDECIACPVRVQQRLGCSGDHEASVGDRVSGSIRGDLRQPLGRLSVPTRGEGDVDEHRVDPRSFEFDLAEKHPVVGLVLVGHVRTDRAGDALAAFLLPFVSALHRQERFRVVGPALLRIDERVVNAAEQDPVLVGFELARRELGVVAGTVRRRGVDVGFLADDRLEGLPGRGVDLVLGQLPSALRKRTEVPGATP
jgi:hypothetical protein